MTEVFSKENINYNKFFPFTITGAKYYQASLPLPISPLIISTESQNT